MLSYFLAIAIAITSVGLYLTAFLNPKIHRKDDFLWSGLGLFYSLILWICAGRITGAVLLGQLAVTSIVIVFIWENRKLRQVITSQQPDVTLDGFSILNFMLGVLSKMPVLSSKQSSVTKPLQPKVKTPTPKDTNKVAEVITKEPELTTPVIIETKEAIPTPEIEVKIEMPTPVVPTKNNEIVTENQIISPEEITEENQNLTPVNTEKNTQEISETPFSEQENLESKNEPVLPLETNTNSITSDNKPEIEKKGLFGKVLSSLGSLTKSLPFGKKSPTNSVDKNKNEKLEVPEISNKIESNIDIANEKKSQEIEEFINDLEETETIETNKVEANISNESDIEITPQIQLNKDTDSYEIIDTVDEKVTNNFELEITDKSETAIEDSYDSDLELDLGVESLDIQSTPLTEENEELELSNEPDLGSNLDNDLDILINEMESEEDSQTKEKETKFNEVPNEDTINLLTDLIEENDLSLEDDLDDLLSESESIKQEDKDSLKKANNSPE